MGVRLFSKADLKDRTTVELKICQEVNKAKMMFSYFSLILSHALRALISLKSILRKEFFMFMTGTTFINYSLDVIQIQISLLQIFNDK